MAQVTSGSVRFEDAIKKPGEGDPQYWLSKKAAVELTFSVDAGEDYQTIFDTVTNAATNRVNSLLNGTSVSAVQSAPATAGETAAAPPTTRKRRTKEEMAADAAAAAAAKDPTAIDDDPTGGQGPSPSVIQLPDGSADPTAIDDDVTSSGAPAAASADVVDDDFTVQPDAAEVSDADLNAAVQKKNADLQDPPAIRTLIGSFNPDPTKVFQLREIPQAQRADFLAKLAALKPKAA